jgi:hypothetical protein
VFPSRPGTVGNEVAERILIALGGALLAVAPYLTWLRVVVLGDFNLSGLLSASHATVAIPYLVTALGVTLFLVPMLTRSIEAVRITALASGSVVLLGGGYATYGLIRAVSDSAGLGQVGPGPIMAVVASVLLIVPPVVAYAREPRVQFARGQDLLRDLFWLPAVVATLIGSAIAWVPYHAGVNNYCGTAVGATLRSRQSLPSSTPPNDIADQLQRDQAAVSSAQAAVNTRGKSDAGASQEQNAADALSAQAQQADTAASNLENTVSGDQGTISGDEGTVSGDQSTVATDQSTVQNDQQTISNDQQTLQNDQQTLASDQQAGYDTSGDQASVSNDQQTIANDQQTLANDQATQGKDQQALHNDQAALNRATATLGADQKALAAAQAAATQLDEKAQGAEQSAQSASDNATQQDQAAQQQLDSAQQQVATDQQNWQTTYQGELTAAENYNTALSKCQDQAHNNLIAAGIITLIGLGISGFLLERRRRIPSPPDTPSPMFPPRPPAAV